MTGYKISFSGLVICFLLVQILFITDVSALNNWETVEVTFTAQNSYANAYKDVEFWVQLQGPGGFDKKVHGFWDGGQTFKVRMVGMSSGTWTWTSHSVPADPGLDGKTGTFTTEDWSEAEKLENPNRRGTIRPTANGHALEYADGTPFFLVSDTHWSAFSFRYPYKGVEPAPDYVPSDGIGYEETVQWLKKLGFNSLGAILVYPSWANDGYPSGFQDNNDIYVRAAWGQVGGTAKDMHDEDGNRPFLFPGKAPGYPTVAPDFDRINPDFFENIDKKFQYCQGNGFYPYVESIRRDHGPNWYAYYDFNESFSRFLLYIRARYGTYNFMYALLHADAHGEAGGKGLPSEVWGAAMNYYHDKYGYMPFGQVTTAMGGATYKTWSPDDLFTVNTCGNGDRDHGMYINMINSFNSTPVKPVFNNEPYYLGSRRSWNVVDGENAGFDTPRDKYFARTQMWGNIFSGGIAGHQYGTVAWNSTIEVNQPGSSDNVYVWHAMNMDGLKEVQYMEPFMRSEGSRYQNLEPVSENLNPRYSPANKEKGKDLNNLDGRAHMLRTPDKKLCYLYFEGKCDKAQVSGLLANKTYDAQWYNPRTGEWSDVGNGKLTANSSGEISMLNFPGDLSQTANNEDWAVKLREEDLTSSPLVSITSPANGASFTSPADVTVNATASDADGSITKVTDRNFDFSTMK